MDKLLTMSKQEITRLETMQRLKEKRMTQKEAGRMLGLSTRKIKRLELPRLKRVVLMIKSR